MFQVGEVVSYGTTGVCTITDIRMESLSRSGTRKQEYYILQPLAAPTCMTYVPTGNEALVAKLRLVMTAAEIDSLIDSVKGQSLDWVEDTRQRAEQYQKILSGGISGQLLLLISRLYQEKKARGRKLCVTDEKIFASAERIVSEEFAYALQIPGKEVSSYIANRMNME